MKKNLTLLASAMFFIATLASCSNDDDYNNGHTNGNDNGYDNGGDEPPPPPPTPPFTLVAQVENGHSLNDRVSYVVAITDNVSRHELARASFADGGFTLTLPTSVDTSYLISIFDRFDERFINVSDSDLKISQIIINGLSASDNRIVEFYYGGVITYNMAQLVTGETFFFYADRDATVVGTFRDGHLSHNIDVSFRKGWNRVYVTFTQTGVVSLNMAYSSEPISSDYLEWGFFE